jgi:hypothetical protein
MKMNNHELEARIAALELRDERRESEHRNLLKSYAALAAEREAERRDLEQDYELFGKSIDERITELKQSIGTGGGDDVTALLHAFGLAVGESMAERLHASEQRILTRVMGWFQTLIGTAEKPSPEGPPPPDIAGPIDPRRYTS